jgi:hypothetical protein
MNALPFLSAYLYNIFYGLRQGISYRREGIEKILRAVRFNNMKKLKLPIIKESPEYHKSLSMDDYIEFVNFNSKYFRRNMDEEKALAGMRVSVPFSVK